MSVEISVDRTADHLVVRWTSGRGSGSARFDRLPGTVPEWLAAADDLLEGATRRDEGQVLDALAAWAVDAGVVVGVWHDDAGIEIVS